MRWRCATLFVTSHVLPHLISGQFHEYCYPSILQRIQPVPSLPLLKGQPGALARDSGERPRQPSAAMGLEYIQWVSSIQLTKRSVHKLSGTQHPITAPFHRGRCHSPLSADSFHREEIGRRTLFTECPLSRSWHSRIRCCAPEILLSRLEDGHFEWRGPEHRDDPSVADLVRGRLRRQA